MEKCNRRWSFYSLTIFSSLLLVLSSCRLWALKRNPLNEDDKKTVSQGQYDSLLKKYEELQSEFKYLKTKENEKNIRIAEKAAMAEPSLGVKPIETVDVFSEEGVSKSKKVEEKRRPVSTTTGNKGFITELSDDDEKVLETHIFELKKAQVAVEQGQHQGAMDLLGKLQKSPYRQIQVRAQFLVAESLFLQEEFNLALQAYEEIIQKNAFSGLVLKTLERVIICTRKLGIKDKEDRYYSILHDFFEGT